MLDLGVRLIAVEAKSGQTVAGDYFASLERLRTELPEVLDQRTLQARVVFGGAASQRRREIEVVRGCTARPSNARRRPFSVSRRHSAGR